MFLLLAKCTANIYVNVYFTIFHVIVIRTDELGEKSKMEDDGAWPMVQKKGNQFVINDQPFYLNGFNTYWLMVFAADQSTKVKVSEVFQQASSAGLTVCRTWAFNDGQWRALQKSPSVYDEEVFKVIENNVSSFAFYIISSFLGVMDLQYNQTQWLMPIVSIPWFYQHHRGNGFLLIFMRDNFHVKIKKKKKEEKGKRKKETKNKNVCKKGDLEAKMKWSISIILKAVAQNLQNRGDIVLIIHILYRTWNMNLQVSLTVVKKVWDTSCAFWVASKF